MLFTPSSKKKRSSRKRYRSPRSVDPGIVPDNRKWLVGVLLVLVLLWSIVVPTVLLELSTSTEEQHYGIGTVLSHSQNVQRQWLSMNATSTTNSMRNMISSFLRRDRFKALPKLNVPLEDSEDAHKKDITKPPKTKQKKDIIAQTPNKKEKKKHNAHASNEDEDGGTSQDLARGAAGLPMDQTPALVGAQRGSIQCNHAIPPNMAYWNNPQGTSDQEFKSPFATTNTGYITFEPDLGGWNNIRMSMESIFVLAAATGRTLVLPPKAPFYLLGQGREGAKSFGNFFPLDQIKIPVISMEEFISKHGGRLLGRKTAKKLEKVSEMCVHRDSDEQSCEILFKELRRKGFQPPLEAAHRCLVFDSQFFKHNITRKDVRQRVDRFCGIRKPYYYSKEMHNVEWIHWDAGHMEYRVLNHFYSFIYFTDPKVDNYHKRFVRDFLHYTDDIFCAAAKIVKSLGKYSSMHIRRGDFQFREARLSAEEWYNNSKHIWNKNEVLYIATDERNVTWFSPFTKRHKVKFLNDYWDFADLDQMDKSYLGMIDTIVASHGRAFCGTWFSSFTGYINRMRGYLGYPMKDSWYAYLPRQKRMHTWEYPNGNYPAREWPIGWVGIDGDAVVEHERQEKASTTKARVVHVPAVSELSEIEDHDFKDRPLRRGVAGLPMSETPALEGASRAHIECDVNVDSLAYWNDPQGKRDIEFQSPFSVKGEDKYITFTADSGGWNNIRMSMEIIFIIAAATGRTLVLPPDSHFYLLHHGKGKNKQRGFADFFPLHTAQFQKRVKVISMEEFIRREGGRDGRLPIPEANRTSVTRSSKHCVNMKKMDNFCDHVSRYLESVGYLPTFRAQDGCVVFDKDMYEKGEISPKNQAAVNHFCGERNITYWDSEYRDPVMIHFRAGQKRYRLLTHFYGMLYFSDPAVGNYFNRFVRDFLHYHDAIYCAAGKIVKSLQVEARQRGMNFDSAHGGGYSAMHIRRGDFQYKNVKLPAQKWYDNTKEIWQPHEILFIATDERNKTWFDPIARHHTLRFLDDYWDMAGLDNLDPNYMGMIDTIVASRARAFAGTFFSTFTGYINRMRGYSGKTMKDSWYSFLKRKTKMHEWKNDSKYAYAWEWPTGWVGIDGDEFPSRDKF